MRLQQVCSLPSAALKTPMDYGTVMFTLPIILVKHVVLLVFGGVAQWLGRRSVAGGLSLIYA